jgi:hypothetical protein
MGGFFLGGGGGGGVNGCTGVWYLCVVRVVGCNFSLCLESLDFGCNFSL